MAFANQIGLWALIALIPFIILYLIRPKIKEMIIPSLMFLMKEKRESKQIAFLKKLLQNLLFIIQFIALIALSVSVASPYFDVPYNTFSTNTIIILDASASMQAKSNGATRFEKAILIAKNNLEGKISIILAENSPVVVLRQGSKDEAMAIFSKLNSKATSTNIGDAIMVVNDILEGKKGRIIVISDFIQTHGQDIMVAKRALVSKGNIVNFFNVYKEATNVGIIDMIIDKYQTKIYIKNYNKNEEKVKIKLEKEKNTIDEKSITILPNSIEALSFETPLSISTIELDVKDDLKVDNMAYISSPLKKEARTLVITNDQKNNFILSALSASKGLAVDTAIPPVIPNLNFDIVFMNKIDYSLLLPGTFKDISRYIDNGGIFILAAQDNLNLFKTEDTLPITLEMLANETTNLCVEVFNQFTSQFENEPCFTQLKRFFKATAVNDSIVIASADKNPIFVLKDKNKGKIFYYGIIDDTSDFKTTPAYPIFWNRLIGFLMETEDIKFYNYKTGDIKIIKEQDVKTPSSIIKTSRLLLDESGIYEFDNKKIAVNLIDEKESDINRESKILEQDQKEFNAEEKGTKRLNLDIPLLIFVTALIIFEIAYLKFRGDI